MNMLKWHFTLYFRRWHCPGNVNCINRTAVEFNVQLTAPCIVNLQCLFFLQYCNYYSKSTRAPAQMECFCKHASIHKETREVRLWYPTTPASLQEHSLTNRTLCSLPSEMFSCNSLQLLFPFYWRGKWDTRWDNIFKKPVTNEQGLPQVSFLTTVLHCPSHLLENLWD